MAIKSKLNRQTQQVPATDSSGRASFDLSAYYINSTLSHNQLEKIYGPSDQNCSFQQQAQSHRKNLYSSILTCNGIKIFGSYFKSFRDDQNHVSNIQMNLPRVDVDVAQLPSMINTTQDMVYFSDESNNRLIPAYMVVEKEKTLNLPTLKIISALDHHVLLVRKNGFHMDYTADVYLINQNESKTSSVTLSNLDSSGNLNGTFFDVFGTDLADSRIKATDNKFIASPNEDNFDFDQVQSYYASQKFYSWLSDSFGFTAPPKPLRVFVDAWFDSPSGGAPINDNAAYIPNVSSSGSYSGDIKIGNGTFLRNLARDNDVINHEIMHSVIFNTLKGVDNAGILIHEGLADFFTFIFHDDPYLGESIHPSDDFLRTALIDKSLMFDDPNITTENHLLGQYISSVLWKVHQEIPGGAGQLLYDSLAYLPEDANLNEFWLAVINADRDLNPLASTEAEHGIYGQNKCLILSSLAERGFSRYVADLDGSSCSLDLAALAAESLTKNPNERFPLDGSSASIASDSKRSSSSDGGCGVIHIGTGSKPQPWSLVLLLIMPLLFVSFSARKKTS